MKIRIIRFPEIKVAALEHQGPQHTLPTSIEHFRAWRKASGLSPITEKRTFGVAISDPERTKPEDFRFDVCAEIDIEVEDKVANNELGIVCKIIPANRCAYVQHVGTKEELNKAANQLLRQWFPQSNEHTGNFPLFFEYKTFNPETPEDEYVTDIYLPLK